MQKSLILILISLFLTAACSSTNTSLGGGGQSQNSANVANTETNTANSAKNKVVENKTKPEVSPTKQADEIPKFKEGEAYKSVREKLIKAGWTPFKSKEADKCLEGDERCQDFPEMQSCVGTGLGNCRYLWKKNNKTLAIFTISDSPIYDGQEFVKPTQQSESDKDDSTWKGEALVHTPPTNVRESPAGKVICVIREKKKIIVDGSTNITDDNGEWIRTNACGKPGVIHSSQINIGN